MIPAGSGVSRTNGEPQKRFMNLTRQPHTQFSLCGCFSTYQAKERLNMNRDFHDYHRGEIYFADLNPVYGHEQGGVRPVLVLQNDVGNYFCPTLIVTQATRRIHKKPSQPTHVVLDDVEGLEPSLFMLEQIRTIDKRRIRQYVGKLTDEQMVKIDKALRTSLHLRDVDFLPTEVDAP
jgi:mRNA interferase MazF